MRGRWLLVGLAVLVAVAATGGGLALSRSKQATPAAQEPSANTAEVEIGKLSAVATMGGTLTYRARPDGSPYSVINQSSGIYSELPEDGDMVACGAVLYRVSGESVLLLCGSTPAYRSLSEGDGGPDVAELNANLVNLGYAAQADLDPSSDYFSFETAAALEKLQAKLGEVQTGVLNLGQAAFLPEAVRIAKVTGQLGGTASP